MSMTTTQAQRLGAVIAKARARKGLSVRALAAQAGVGYAWITNVEGGQYLAPAPARLARLAEALDIEPARLDRLMQGAVADSLPELPTYFRAKYRLTPDQIQKIERYIARLRRTP